MSSADCYQEQVTTVGGCHLGNDPPCREDAYAKFRFHSPPPETPSPTDSRPDARAPSLPFVPPRPASTMQSADIAHKRSPSGSGLPNPILPPLPPGGVEAILRPPIVSPRPRDLSPAPVTPDGPVAQPVHPPVPVPRRLVSLLSDYCASHSE